MFVFPLCLLSSLHSEPTIKRSIILHVDRTLNSFYSSHFHSRSHRRLLVVTAECYRFSRQRLIDGFFSSPFTLSVSLFLSSLDAWIRKKKETEATQTSPVARTKALIDGRRATKKMTTTMQRLVEIHLKQKMKKTMNGGCVTFALQWNKTKERDETT